MTEVQVLADVHQIAVQAGFWVALAFPVVTGAYWPWHRSWWGRNLVALDMVIMLALLGSTLHYEFGLDYGHAPGHVLLWVTAVSLCLVPAVLIWRMVMIWLVQRTVTGRDQDREDPAGR